MRYPPGHKERTRRRIVSAAGRLFRENGYAATGVDGVMGAAGLTPGGFYTHFRSKEALLAETVDAALERTRTLLTGGLDERTTEAWLRGLVRRYLSRAHRDAADRGCPLPALGSEVARSGDAARGAVDRHILELLRAAQESGDVDADPNSALPDASRHRLLAVLALCAGGVLLARSVKDPALSDEVLAACRTLAEDAIGGE